MSSNAEQTPTTDLRKLERQWKAAPRLQCVECGWTNIKGRGCCESCGQEDWEPKRSVSNGRR